MIFSSTQNKYIIMCSRPFSTLLSVRTSTHFCVLKLNMRIALPDTFSPHTMAARPPPLFVRSFLLQRLTYSSNFVRSPYPRPFSPSDVCACNSTTKKNFPPAHGEHSSAYCYAGRLCGADVAEYAGLLLFCNDKYVRFRACAPISSGRNIALRIPVSIPTGGKSVMISWPFQP